VADSGPDRYRRGMYTFFWRSSPHPGVGYPTHQLGSSLPSAGTLR
jgi:hypothetical protein